jgi:hypothetical protein
MEAIYIKDDIETNFRGGFSFESSQISEQIEGGGKPNRFSNKAIPFGLAIKRVKPQIGKQCKNGDVLNNDMFEKLFNTVAKIERSNGNKKDHNKTKKSIK